ncbi:MAG TPA: hypothetical protein VLE97_01685 [Gaiellaceae bacterium]|nr:hypothetical protein [Gaiellaceae bacterium]
MNRRDVLALRAGDSVVGFNGCWTDEFRVTAVHLRNALVGRACNDVCVTINDEPVWALVREGGDEIRTAENLTVV